MKVADLIESLQKLPPDAEVEASIRLVLEDISRPMTNAERAREFRRRKRENVTPRNAVSLRGVRGEICEVSEKEAEKEEEIGYTCQVDLGASVTKRNDTSLRSKRWRRVPEGWQPNDAHRSIAASRGVDFDLELAKFRDHDFAAPKSNADATFRNWLRNATPLRGSVTQYKSAATVQLERAASLAAAERKALA